MQLIQRFFQAWYRFITTRKSNAGTLAAVGGSLLVFCCGGSLVLSAVQGAERAVGILPAPTPHRIATTLPVAQLAGVQATAPGLPPTSLPTEPPPTEQPTTPPTDTPTTLPTDAPTATPAPPTGKVLQVAHLRLDPGPTGVDLGMACANDALEFLSQRQIGDELWYKVRLVAKIGCNGHGALETLGWLRSDFVSPPSSSVADYDAQTGKIIPTARPVPTARPRPTAVPQPTVHPTAVPQPVAPPSSGVRVGATCRDGSHSNATGSGACSHHGGVAQWLYR